MSNPNYSDYLVFVDESGSPHMGGEIDPQYPLFVLAFLIVKKSDYIEKVCPALQAFKFKHFCHDHVILHERDIRQDLGCFSFLKTRDIKNAFLNELTGLVEEMPIHLSVVVIDKAKHQKKYHEPADPYHLGLQFGLERIVGFLRNTASLEAGIQTYLTHVVVEGRGKREDQDLELAFRRICDSESLQGERNIFEIIFADKKSNSAGLQLADLIARPVGMSVLRPDQENRAMKIIMKKFLHKNGKIEGWGLKCFP